MINKRLLIKNLLAHNDENSFYDKKLKLNMGSREGKAKFLKHICALCNSNPNNNSFLVIGVKDENNDIVGVDFFDDSKIQNLINSYLDNPPQVRYENILFPHLSNGKVVGLVIIGQNNGKVCALRRNIWKYYGGTVFFRDGSISKPRAFDIERKDINSDLVSSIENHSQNTVEHTLDGVFDFMEKNKDYHPKYCVFREYFVVCWAGKKKETQETTYYSRVNIELINEQVKLFYSDLDEVGISFDEEEFRIVEYVRLGLYGQHKHYPLEEVVIQFKSNMGYELDSQMLFEPPQFQREILHHIYNSNRALLKKIGRGEKLLPREKKDLNELPTTYLLCYFNGFSSAVDQLTEAKQELKDQSVEAYQAYKEVMRILRKIKYN